jgi:hypothetical protein
MRTGFRGVEHRVGHAVARHRHGHARKAVRAGVEELEFSHGVRLLSVPASECASPAWWRCRRPPALFHQHRVAPRRLRAGAVARHHHLQAAHARIGRGAQHALVAGNAGHDQPVHAQHAQQLLQRRGHEGRLLRLEHEVVVVVRQQRGGDRRALPAATTPRVRPARRSPIASGPGCRSRRSPARPPRGSGASTPRCAGTPRPRRGAACRHRESPSS